MNGGGDGETGLGYKSDLEGPFQAKATSDPSAFAEEIFRRTLAHFSLQFYMFSVQKVSSLRFEIEVLGKISPCDHWLLLSICIDNSWLDRLIQMVNLILRKQL